VEADLKVINSRTPPRQLYIVVTRSQHAASYRCVCCLSKSCCFLY